jgi:hypothetical protein
MDHIVSVGRFKSGTSLVQNLVKSWTGWGGIKDGGILQNDNCGCS